jgi:citrate lyase subunit beta/citryl-CoA lyase
MPSAPRIIRSLLLVSASNEQAIDNACAARPDAICLDFEDLTPADQKDRARSIFAEMAERIGAVGALVFMRTNALESGHVELDLQAAVGAALHCVDLPKVESAESVVRYAELVTAAERRNGVAEGTLRMRPLCETPLGIHLGYEIASASDRITYMGGVSGGWWGDLGATLGHLDTHDGKGTLYLRSKMLMDVRAAGVLYPLSGGAIRSRGPEDLRSYYQECKVLGYTGVHCPPTAEAVAIANEVFLPAPEDLAGWLKYLPALEAAEANGETSIWHDGKHLDIVCLPRIRAQLELRDRVSEASPTAT